MIGFLKRYWFLVGLSLVFVATLADTSQWVPGTGRWLAAHHGLPIAVCLIFFLSGLLLDLEQIRDGLMDVKGVLLTLGIIFVVSPLLAALSPLLPVTTDIVVGVFLVAVMPTTLSSGVVMTAVAGGRMGQALVITILANGLSVFTIPFTLTLLLGVTGDSVAVVLDKAAMMMKLGALVILPLAVGMVTRFATRHRLGSITPVVNIINQGLVITIVWMAISGTRLILLQGYHAMGWVVLVSLLFHGGLLAAAGIGDQAFKLGRGRRESLIFMGAQKTLPLSIILQVAYFPQYGLAAVVCVVHHVVQLLIDGYLVGVLQRAGKSSAAN